MPRDNLLSQAQTLLRHARLASLPVVNAHGQLKGVLLRRHLTAQTCRRVILADHNDTDQTAPGVTESEIIAIVDHHNLGGLQTLRPLTILCKPVGSTCTLMAEFYNQHHVSLHTNPAGAMLAVILSDTVHFRSTTITARDRAAAAWVEQQIYQVAVSVEWELFRAGLPTPLPLAPGGSSQTSRRTRPTDKRLGLGKWK